MKFIKSDSEEEMDMLAAKTPQIAKAVEVLKELSADEQTRMLYEKREMARRDYDSRVEEVERKWQGVIADKDAELADKDAIIAQLKAQLGKSE